MKQFIYFCFKSSIITWSVMESVPTMSTLLHVHLMKLDLTGLQLINIDLNLHLGT